MKGDQWLAIIVFPLLSGLKTMYGKAKDRRLLILLLFAILVFSVDFAAFFSNMLSPAGDELSGDCLVRIKDRLEVGPCSTPGDPFFVSDRALLMESVPVNLANEADLTTISGIGPSLAKKIIMFRDQYGSFSSSAELIKVPGIGPARAAVLSSQLSFEPQ